MMMLTPTRRQSLLLLCGLLMIAATLRVTFTGVAPLLEMIRASYGLTTAQTGLLTTLPLLAFAMVSPMVARIAGRYGMEKSLAGALILMMAGIAIRSLNGAGWLFTGTALIGCAIATGNVLLPGLIKRDFPGQVAKLTGAYSLTMGMAAALGSAFVVPLAVAGPGWRGALLSMMIFPLLALVIWLTQCRHHVAATLTASGALRRPSLWRSARAWQVTLFLGLNSLVYYVVIGWLPSILISYGFSEAHAGSLHGLLQLATASPGLLIPLLLMRVNDHRGIAVLVSALCALSAPGLWLMPGLASVWVIMFGVGSGATMILGLTFIGLRSGSAHQAAALSGMAQSVGYLLAACGPPVMGKIHDLTGGWGTSLVAVAVLSLAMAIAGGLAARDGEITPQRD